MRLLDERKLAARIGELGATVVICEADRCAGAVGRATKWRLEGLGMTVVSYGPYAPDATHADLDAMLGECDVVSMHAAVTPTTLGLIDADRFAAMRDGAVYLNSARAALHDTNA